MNLVNNPPKTALVFRGFLSLKVCAWRGHSVQTIRHPLSIFHAPKDADLLIDKQKLVRDKVLQANNLCCSDTIDVRVRRQFDDKTF
jgi:hypothetical protein